MWDFVFISGAARDLSELLGIAVRPQDLTNLLYRRELRDDLCPVVSGRRLIPRDYLPAIAAYLRGHARGQVTGQEAAQ
jgi:hypothetical protein